MTDNETDAKTRARRFPPPWQVEQIPGGFKVLDASGQALAYVYAQEGGPATLGRRAYHLSRPIHKLGRTLQPTSSLESPDNRGN
jgi:hypothetical protein